MEIDRQELSLLEQKVKSGMTYEQAYAESTKKASAVAKEHAVEYSRWFYISCPVIWKSLFISAFCVYRIIISVETLVKTATHRRCGKVLTNIPTEMDKSSSTK